MSEPMVQVQQRITALLDTDPSRLGQTELQDNLLAVHAATAMLTALAARLTTELTERGASSPDGTYVEPRAWLGEQLATDHWTTSAGEHLPGRALSLAADDA